MRSPKASNEHAFHDITVRHLLNHTSGLDSQWWVDLGRGDCARRMAARAIAATPLLARPGELFSYSGPAFVIAGYLTDLLSRACWEEQVRTTVAGHLGSHSVAARPEDVLLGPSATGYVSPGSGGQNAVAAARWYAPLALSPGGGLVGTTADLARLMRAVRTRLRIDSLETDMAGPATVPTVGWRYAGWGLGMAKYQTKADYACWGHDGTTSGQAYAVRFAQGRPETVVVATNAAWSASHLGRLAETILDGLLGNRRDGRAADRADPLSGYGAWRLPADAEVTGTYLRLNSTVRVRSVARAELEVEEISSPQDEENWFGGSRPYRGAPTADRLRHIEGHSYESKTKQFHFLAHPNDPARIYIHNGMRANVKIQRPWT
ncbi:serine hydrolase (plasmid) [Ensifer adhaerens]|uniref:serine hydrolase domain-containing protein n=1 Tax=Ensifer adhaerens TaxID=106592 RepID=UPI0023A9F8EB|nr:serine hydrolase [Ensifer adhaerens]WDZ81463.1 serine hydrolase [Ensifer adhaerens]